jgi:hypothetical protein
MFVSDIFRWLNLHPLCDAPDDGGGGGDDADANALSQDLAELGDEGEGDGDGEDGDDDEGEGDGDDEGEKDGDESADDEEDDEEDGEGDDEDEEEETDADGKKKKKVATPEEDTDEYGRPTVKALKKEFPGIFKKYPALRAAFFEYPKYVELFSDIDVAQSAAQKASEYDQLDASVSKGESKELLSTLHENNPKALKTMVRGFAERVRDVDADLYPVLAEPIIEELLYHASQHGTRAQNKNLVLAAKHIANFVFANGGEIPDISKRAKETKNDEPTEAEKQLEAERRQYRTEKFEGALMDVGKRCQTELGAVLGNKLSELTPFERKQVIREAQGQVDAKLKADGAFQKTLAALWKKAADDGYSDASKTRIRRAWLERAKAIAPGIRNRLRKEALEGRTERTPSREDSGQQGKKRTFPSQGGRSGSSSKRVLDPKKIDWKKTSDMDILNG